MKVTVQEHEDICWARDQAGSKIAGPNIRNRLMALRRKRMEEYEVDCQSVNGNSP